MKRVRLNTTPPPAQPEPNELRAALRHWLGGVFFKKWLADNRKPYPPAETFYDEVDRELRHTAEGQRLLKAMGGTTK